MGRTDVGARCARSLLFHAPESRFDLVESMCTAPQAGEVLVEVACCTLCASDLHTMHGRRVSPSPSVLGHEVVGRILTVGSQGVRDLQGAALAPGDRVTWSLVVPCGVCRACSTSRPEACRDRFKYGHERYRAGENSGGLADVVKLRPRTSIARVPEELTDEVAAMASCAGATAHAALRVAGDLRDRSIVVFGAGLLGLCATDFATQLGARRVVVVDPDGSRRERARNFGASDVLPGDAALDLLRDLEPDGFDVAIEASGSTSACSNALAALGIGGSAVFVGAVFPTKAIEISPEDVVRRRMSLRGVHNYLPVDLESALSQLKASKRDYAACFARPVLLAALGAQRPKDVSPEEALRLVIKPV